MKRIFHHYLKWEDYQSGMWRTLSGAAKQQALDAAIKFTGDHQLYGSWMLKVLEQWPTACEQNLSDVRQNRKAWIGHAACCLAIGCPEDITRSAWGALTQEQQDLANAEAQSAIQQWETSHDGHERKNPSVHREMAEAGV